MEEIIKRECPKCKQVSSYNLADLIPFPFFRGTENKPRSSTQREYPATCPACGHEFILLFNYGEISHGKQHKKS